MRRPLRDRLMVAGSVISAALIVGALAACAPPPGQTTGGDTVTLGVVGNTKDTIYPYSSQNSPSNNALWAQMYDGLTYLDNEGGVQMALAESMTPNADDTVWTIHLRPGVKLHSGRTFGADDVIYSVTKMLDPKSAYTPSTQINMVDPNGITKVDDLIVQMKLTRPYGPFPSAWSSDRLVMVGKDWTEQNPDGTGPFTVDAFTPGQEGTFTKFDGYYGQKPNFKHLRLVYFQDQPAITNALRGGQIDIAFTVPFTDVTTLRASPGIKILESESAGYLIFEMRLDVPPFTDPRVREAFRLIVDRDQIAKNAFGGYARPANDYLGNNTPCPPPAVPQRTQDIARAKQLLAEAGQTNISVELPTDAAFPGMLEAAQLFAQQAAQAGVTVTVRKMDGAAFLNKWLQWPFLVGYSSSPYFITATSHFAPAGEENATHFDDPEYNRLSTQLYATSDQRKQCDAITQMQRIEHERGGDIVPIYPKQLIAYNERVQGLRPDLYGRGSFEFRGVSLTP
ncbi:ABC transporter substrate-binding protein [Pseudonocardia acaciae]|uniref:ABC transporter substrate-binding protein n=1 Tax=Pseudonocardia acaciae TaxID=551276 RepID=UPI0012EE8359|nr:ABC transporter substrate-binding protein [Pseudonocardia acaciae]